MSRNRIDIVNNILCGGQKCSICHKEYDRSIIAYVCEDCYAKNVIDIIKRYKYKNTL